MIDSHLMNVKGHVQLFTNLWISGNILETRQNIGIFSPVH